MIHHPPTRSLLVLETPTPDGVMLQAPEVREEPFFANSRVNGLLMIQMWLLGEHPTQSWTFTIRDASHTIGVA